MKKSNLMFFKSKTKIKILTVHCTQDTFTIIYKITPLSTQRNDWSYLTAQCKALTLTVWDPVVSNLPEGVGV